MLYICKVKPSKDECGRCKIQAFHSEIEVDCEECADKNEIYGLVNVGYNRSVGDWAMVMKNGIIKRVSLDRVFDIISDVK